MNNHYIRTLRHETKSHQMSLKDFDVNYVSFSVWVW